MTEEQKARQRIYNKRHYYKNQERKIQYMRDYRAKKKAEKNALLDEVAQLKAMIFDMKQGGIEWK